MTNMTSPRPLLPRVGLPALFIPGKKRFLGGKIDPNGPKYAILTYCGLFRAILAYLPPKPRFPGIHRAGSPTLGRRGRGEGIFVIPTSLCSSVAWPVRGCVGSRFYPLLQRLTHNTWVQGRGPLFPKILES